MYATLRVYTSVAIRICTVHILNVLKHIHAYTHTPRTHAKCTDTHFGHSSQVCNGRARL